MVALGKKGSDFQITVHHTEKPRQELKQEFKVEAMEERG